MSYSLWLALILMMIGAVLSSYAFSMLPDPKLAPSENNRLNNPLAFMLSLWFGFFFIGTPLAYISAKTTRNPISLSSIDWILILFTILFMPIFQVLGLPFYLWFFWILLPTFSIRVLLKLYARNMLKKALPPILFIALLILIFILYDMSLIRID